MCRDYKSLFSLKIELLNLVLMAGEAMLLLVPSTGVRGGGTCAAATGAVTFGGSANL